MKNYRLETLDGISWNLKNHFLSQIINFIIGVVLVRLLTPKDFGLITMAVLIFSFAAIIRDLGLSNAIIHQKKLNNKTLSTAFWIQLFIGFLLAILFLLLSQPIAIFFDEPQVRPIVIFLSIEYLIGALGIIQFAKLERELNFQKIFYINIFSTVSSSFVAITMALFGFNFGV